MRGGSGDVPTMVTVPASASLNVMTREDSMSDDVFHDEDDNPVSAGLTPSTMDQPLTTTPSPTGYRDYKPPAEVFTENYGYSSTMSRDNLKRTKDEDACVAHKTILLGDSGVGKTSLLVQFDTGKFQLGNFAATVGIGFTVSPKPHQLEPSKLLGGFSAKSRRISVKIVAACRSCSRGPEQLASRVGCTFTRRPAIGQARAKKRAKEKAEEARSEPLLRPSPPLVQG